MSRCSRRCPGCVSKSRYARTRSLSRVVGVNSGCSLSLRFDDMSPTGSAGGSPATDGRRMGFRLPSEVSVRVLTDTPVALVDDARAEGPGFDQVERNVFCDRRQERRAATDDDRIAEHAQFVDEAEMDGRSG
jgi:hypothetical protein